MPVALLYLYSGAGSFAVLDLHALPLGLTAQKLVFVAFLAAFAVASVTGRAVCCAMAQRPAQHESAMYAASVRDRMGGCRFALPHPLVATRHDGGSMR